MTVNNLNHCTNPTHIVIIIIYYTNYILSFYDVFSLVVYYKVKMLGFGVSNLEFRGDDNFRATLTSISLQP